MFCLCACDSKQSPQVKVRVTSLSIPNTPWHDFWLRFEQAVNESGADDIDLDMFIAGELGGEETALANLRRGRVQVGGFALQGLATLIPELNVLLLPYMFESRDEVAFVMDNYVADAFSELFAEKNLTLIQWSEVGWFYIYSKTPVVLPSDAAGLSMRASNAMGSRYFADAIGADQIPLSFPEVIPALQTNLIESGQSGVGMYTLAGIAKEAPHLTLTRHAFDMGPVLMNKEWLDGLSDRHREIVLGSVEEVNASRRAIRSMLDGFFADELPKMNVHLHELTAAQVAEWRRVALPTHQQLIDNIGGDAAYIYDLIQQGIADYRRQHDGIDLSASNGARF